MEGSLWSLYHRQPPRFQLTRGMAWSMAIHIVVVALTIVVPGLLPKRIVPLPFYSVDLVTLEQAGLGDGGPMGAGPGKPAATKAASTKAHSPIPVMPVERLRPQSVAAPVTPLKKLGSSVEPEQLAKSTSGVIDKSLDKLIQKPKQPKEASPAEAPQADKKAGGATIAAQQGTADKSPQAAPGKESGGAGQTAAAAAGKPGSGAPGAPGTGAAASGGDPGQIGLARRLYYAEVWSIIRREWSLDTTRLKGQHLEAIIILVVSRDGKILSYRFEKKSGNSLLDESAERAVRKVDSLPPFPKIYSPPQEEIGIRFRPEDLA
jgi:colicin import membrane protein